MSTAILPLPPPTPLSDEEFDTLEDILRDISTREAEVTTWEYLDGVLAGLVCCRDPISDAEAIDFFFPEFEDEAPLFADAAQKDLFLFLWQRRRAEIAYALSMDIERLTDEEKFQPYAADVLGAWLTMKADEEEAKSEQTDEAKDDTKNDTNDESGNATPEQDTPDLPSYGQMWAMGFMTAVETWPDAWATPRHPETAEWFDDALDDIVAMTEDDDAPPIVNFCDSDGPPSVSRARVEQFRAMVWALYDLYQIARRIGPRQLPLVKPPKLGRNDPCWCGSGKKYKKCHGA